MTKTVSTQLVDFDQPRDQARTATQASLNFITNKEQGDWAEVSSFTTLLMISGSSPKSMES
jgi:hypothetical protein